MSKYQDVLKWIKFLQVGIDNTSRADWHNHYNNYYLNVNIAGLQCRYEIGENFTWAYFYAVRFGS